MKLLLELTEQEIKILEENALKKTIKMTPNATGMDQLVEVIAQLAVRATIATIREYEQMKDEK